MLQFTRTQSAAIVITVLLICGLSLPNFLSEKTIAGWPQWAQHRITLAPELQGGTSALLQVDRNDVRAQFLASLFRDVLDVLRDAHVGVALPLAIRSGSVEIRPLAGDFDVALANLGSLSRAFNGVRPVDVTDEGGGLIRVTPTEAGLREHELPIVRSETDRIRTRIFGLYGGYSRYAVPATVEREGSNRVRVQAPGLLEPQRLKY